jgi:uncharacterized membrane protein YjgN (DUF898 family)
MSIEQAVAAQPADSATPVAPARRLAVTFTGSGSEYFRIWIVNLLLTLLSLSLYYPFAKARRLAYFHGNTLVDGLPLGFHGNPRKMLRGHLLMLVLGAAYAVAIRFSPLSAAVALVVIAAVWPALWRAALQFRMANTSWRGLRMRFGGTLGGAYRALLPVFLPGTAIFLAGAMAPESQVMDPESAQRLMWLVLGVMLVSLLASPLLLLAIKRYQHGGYRLARDTSRLETRAGAFYMLSLKSIGVTLASVALAMVIMAGLFYVVREQLSSEGPVRSAMMFAPIALAYLLMFVIPWPYWAARLQNLVWSQTCSSTARCRHGPWSG